MSDLAAILGQPVALQLVEQTNKSREDKIELLQKIEVQCRAADKAGKGKLTPEDFYKVVKFQCHIDYPKEEVISLVEHLPRDSKGRVLIDDFCRTPILSEEVFNLMDKNNDGEVTKREIKLAHKQLTMKQIEEIMRIIDENRDGRISLEEFNHSS